MALATLNPIHWLSGATDARNKIEGSSVLKVRHLFIPIVGTHAVISAPEIRTRDKARLAFYPELGLESICLVSMVGGRASVHHKHAHRTRVFRQTAVGILGDRASGCHEAKPATVR